MIQDNQRKICLVHVQFENSTFIFCTDMKQKLRKLIHFSTRRNWRS